MIAELMQSTKQPKAGASVSVAAPRPSGVVMRIYPQLRSTLIAGAQLATGKIYRHDIAVLLCVGGPQAEMVIETDKATLTARAAVVAPNTLHRVRVKGGQLIRLSVQLTHPRFCAIRATLNQPVTPWPHSRVSQLEPRLQAACDGQITYPLCCQLIEEIIDAAVEGHSPTRAMDPRIRATLHKLGTNLDYPFGQLAKELCLSPSRLSHLFTETLGISMRGCQAWGRMGSAWELVIWNRELSLTEIAHLTKFSDSSHLARAFTRGYGITPTAFRNRALVEVVGGPLRGPAEITPATGAGHEAAK